MSLSRKQQLDEVKKKDRYYLRYYLTIKKAINLNEQIYGDKKSKSSLEFKVEHPLRIAALTEEILNQRISDYHMTWLVGLLHDTKEDSLHVYSNRIDDVLEDLTAAEQQTVKMYINQLTSDQTLSKGQKKKDQLLKMEILELIPCWIRIFDKFDNCRRFISNPVGKTKEQIDGYCAIAYLCYRRALERFEPIRLNLQQQIRNFYEEMCVDIGGFEHAKQLAEQYFVKYKE